MAEAVLNIAKMVREALSQMRPDLAIASDVLDERQRQDAKWGEQHHPDGTGLPADRKLADLARRFCDAAHKAGRGTWRQILHEEVQEAFAESDPDRLEAELVQVAAVAQAWIKDIRSRRE